MRHYPENLLKLTQDAIPTTDAGAARYAYHNKVKLRAAQCDCLPQAQCYTSLTSCCRTWTNLPAVQDDIVSHVEASMVYEIRLPLR